MNLQGMKQIEVEKLFSKDEMNKQIKAELKGFMSNIEKEHYLALHKALDGGNDKQFTVNVMVQLINKLGNPKLGVVVDGVRKVDVNHLVSIIAGLPLIVERYNSTHKYTVAVEIIEELDTILFDIVQSKRNDPDYGWTTETSAIIEFNVAESALKLEGLSRYKFPFIEKPLDWKHDEKGGYHLEELRESITTNKGSNNQPQNVLDVINILQGNKYILRDIDINDEYKYCYDKMSKKAVTPQQIRDLPLNVDTRLLTCYETYSAMMDEEFYFQWKLDCRGRMYSSGYDINLQADKFKKGIIKPVMLSSDRRVELELELKELECQDVMK